MRAIGLEAYSCDIQECSGGHPEWHIMGDVIPLLNGFCRFRTMDGVWHELDDRWEMIIAHPPCTYLSAAGAQRTFPKAGIPDPVRYEKGEQAARFFKEIFGADCSRIVVENPVPMKCFGLPQYSQIVHPFMFGDPWYKRTCFWIKGLPALEKTNEVKPEGYWVQRSGVRAKGNRGGHRDPKLRSKTFPGIAKAMAEQWGRPLKEGKL